MFKGLAAMPFISEVPAFVQEEAYLAIIPSGIVSKPELFSVYRKEFCFPDYFNLASWDSFDECLRTLDNIEQMSMVIAHEDLPLAADRKDLLIYLDVLQYCASFHEAYIGRKFIVTFPPAVRGKISEAYQELRQRELSTWVIPYDPSAFTFVRPYDSGCIPEDGELLIEIPSGIRTRQELIAAFPCSIDPWLLPKAKGWLAIKEVLGAIGSPIKHICLVHEGLPLESHEELKCYLDVLLALRDTHERVGFTKFDVVFPNYAEEQIRRCIFELRIEREQWRNVADLRAGIL